MSDVDDDLSGLPQQVQDLARYSREAKDEIRKSQAGETGEETPEAPQESAAPVEAQVEAEKAPEPVKPPEDEWKRKHDLLYGKYSAEIGQAREQIRALQGEVSSLKDALAKQPEAAAPDSKGSLDPKAFEDYDENFKRMAEVVNRLESDNATLRQELMQRVGAQVENRIAPIAEHVAQREYEDFLVRLGSNVPRMAEINVDPDFLQWLDASVNPYDGIPMKDTLERAVRSRNVAGAAKVFLDFAAMANGKYAPKPAQAAAPRPRNIQPAQGASPQPQDNNGVRHWTTAEVERFYADVAQGRYRGRDAEVAAMKREIFKAGSAGLIA